MTKSIINTANAPEAIGTYSQAVKHGDCLYISGQIPLDPKTMLFVSEEINGQIHQVFKNLQAVCNAANNSLNDIVKLNIFLTDLSCFSTVNEIMSEYFEQPYPARAAVGVKELPKGALVEMDAVVGLS